MKGGSTVLEMKRFALKDVNDRSLTALKNVLVELKHSQHCTVLINFGMSIQIIRSHPGPRWNLGNANWVKLTEQVKNIASWIPPTSKIYERFVGTEITSSKATIPSSLEVVIEKEPINYYTASIQLDSKIDRDCWKPWPQNIKSSGMVTIAKDGRSQPIGTQKRRSNISQQRCYTGPITHY